MNKWIIKFLTGSHQGAEIELHHGTHTLGSSEEDDLVVRDAALKSGHVHIELNETSALLKLHKGSGNIFIDGIEYKSDTEENIVQVDISNTITIGTLKFIIGNHSENWEAVTLPLTEVKIDEKDVVPIDNHRAKKPNSIIAKTMLVGGVIAMALVAFIMLNNDNHDSEDKNNLPSQLTKWEQIKTKFDSKAIEFIDSPTNANIQGQVQTINDYKLLTSLVDLVGIKGTTEVVVDEELAQKIELEIMNLGEDRVNISIGPKTGILVAKGITSNPKELSDLLKKYASDSKALNEIVNETLIEEGSSQPANINIGLRIKSVNLGRTPYFITEDGQIMVSGSKLNNGLKVDSINTDFIQLTRGDKLFRHQLGGL